MSQKLIVVFGATGMQGGSVVQAYLKDSKYRVRAVTRNLSSDSAQKLSAQGVEVVKGDLDDLASLKEAVKGANVVFGVTDIKAHLGDPELHKQLQPGDHIGPLVAKREIEQVERLVSAVNELTNTTLERFIFSTLPNVAKESNGKFKHAYHFDSKATAVDNLETSFPKLAAKTSYIMLGAYYENWQLFPIFRPHKQDDGVFQMTMPAHPDKPFTYVWTTKDVGNFVKALEKQPAGTTLLAYSEEVTPVEWLKMWGDYNNVQTRYVQSSPQELEDEMGHGSGVGLQIAEASLFFGEFGFGSGNGKNKKPQDLGIQTTSLKKWLKSVDWKNTEEYKGVL